MLVESLRSARRELRLNASRAVVVFDGLLGKPGATGAMRSHYALKIRRVLKAAPDADVLLSEGWLHQANSLRCAMTHIPHTPLVFVIQDDTQVGPGGIDIAHIHRHLSRDPSVEYVRLASDSDCNVMGRMQRGYVPCTAHPRSPMLHRTHRWLDRPHLAARHHYDEQLFRTLPFDAKVTPEQVLDQRSRMDANWSLWVYGRRGDMQRDLHWPQRINGRLVSKELAGDLVRRGKLNLTLGSTYAHSYLIHAYAGRTQDVNPTQIRRQIFRTHNPIAWDKEDRLSEAGA